MVWNAGFTFFKEVIEVQSFRGLFSTRRVMLQKKKFIKVFIIASLDDGTTVYIYSINCQS